MSGPSVSHDDPLRTVPSKFQSVDSGCALEWFIRAAAAPLPVCLSGWLRGPTFMGQRKILGGQRTRLRPDSTVTRQDGIKATLGELSTLLRETVTRALTSASFQRYADTERQDANHQGHPRTGMIRGSRS
jgi:hypothetical protein